MDQLGNYLIYNNFQNVRADVLSNGVKIFIDFFLFPEYTMLIIKYFLTV